MTVLVHGLGREGAAAAAYLRSPTAHPSVRGRTVLVVEDRPEAETPPGCERLERAEAMRRLRGGTLYLRSPGVPPSDPLVRDAVAKGAEVTSPTGFYLSRHAPPGTVTVTGTKGKSTTTALLSAILTAGGHEAAAYGNIGRPPLGLDLPTEAHPVVELSSYMCHDLSAPVPGRSWWRAHLVTNLHKEHTDWHGSEESYRAAKLRPFRTTGPDGDPCPGLAPSALIAAGGLSAAVRALEEIVPIEDGRLLIASVALDASRASDACRSLGTLLAVRAAAAVALDLLGSEATREAVTAALAAWRGLPSRQAGVPSRDGRSWVDDALATVPEATSQALARFGDRPVRLVLGGKDRGQDLGDLVRAVGALPDGRAFGFGEVSAALAALGVPPHETMEDAVLAARAACPRGGVVLFSPAAPSGPPHRSYEERAAIFAALAAESR